MIQDENIQPGQMRVLEVDERLVLPTNTLVRLLVTASDVIHTWYVPALGIKIDAMPGRLNQVRVCRPTQFLDFARLKKILLHKMPTTVGPLSLSVHRPSSPPPLQEVVSAHKQPSL